MTTRKVKIETDPASMRAAFHLVMPPPPEGSTVVGLVFRGGGVSGAAVRLASGQVVDYAAGAVRTLPRYAVAALALPPPQPAVTLYGRTFQPAVAPCGCCGLAPERTAGRFGTWRAGLCDADGVFYSYLCGQLPDGGGGCLEEIAADVASGVADSARQGLADVMADLSGDDTDSTWAAMEDNKPGHSY
jgi:hypothetical protein